MAGFLIGLFFVGLILLCGFITLLILMQRPNANSGMGAALGGGAAEQAFGGETGNVLTRWTTRAIIVFFVLCLGLYLAVISSAEMEETFELPEITGTAPAEDAPAEEPVENAGPETVAPEGETGVLDLREGMLGNAGVPDVSEGTDGAGDSETEANVPEAEAEPETGADGSRMPGS